MKERLTILTLLRSEPEDWKEKTVGVCGWIRTMRNQKACVFIELNDGSSLSNLQLIVEHTLPDYKEVKPLLSTGAAIQAKGRMAHSPGAEQHLEMQVSHLSVYGPCPDHYPLQKKGHSLSFLRSLPHLRSRTNMQGALARIRSRLAYYIHHFFQQKGFVYLQSPMITHSDCEGAGALFQVTTLPLDHLPTTSEGKVDYGKDFFSHPAYLTVSGQLNAEAYACSHSQVYTFGPTFRAEHSHTPRHLAEFWMVEPEVAFVTLPQIIELAEELITYLVKEVLTHCREDLSLFHKWVDPQLFSRLEKRLNLPPIRLTYSEAVNLLQKANRVFSYPARWGQDLQSEHEHYLIDAFDQATLILTDYPKESKAFYMRENADGNTVAAFDMLLPKIGEVIGGSQREERESLLRQKIASLGLSPQKYDWYLELRNYGSVPHGGFGMGFERFVQFVTGVDNIREVVAFPRAPAHCLC